MTFEALLLTYLREGEGMGRDLASIDQGRVGEWRVASKTISKLVGSNAVSGCSCPCIP